MLLNGNYMLFQAQNSALALYARGILGFGKARELCGLTKWQFEELLGRRKIVRPYDEDDLAVDLAYARRSQ
jgi:predicted HTH domain antitoxin